MSLEDLVKLVTDFINKFRRHNHDGIETDKLPSSSIRSEGTAGQIFTSNGPDSPPSFQDPGGSSSGAYSLISTTFENSARFGSSGSVAFGSDGAVLSPLGNGGNALVTWILAEGGSGIDNIFTGSPIATGRVVIYSTGLALPDMQVYFGLGEITFSNSGGSYNQDHAGFKLVGNGGSGAKTLYATTGDGTAETAVAVGTFGSLSVGFSFDFMIKLTGDANVTKADFYYKTSLGTWSLLTSITTNLPRISGSNFNKMQAAYSLNAGAGTGDLRLLGASYKR